MAEPRRRMLVLLSLLQTGRAWTGADLAHRLETSPRTLRRDVDQLRDLGYPVQTRPGPGGHYRLVAGTAMPPLLLDDEEAVAVAVGLRMAAQTSTGPDDEEAAARALRKLEQVLPSRLRQRVSAVHETTETSAPLRTSVPTRLLGLVGTAAQRQERLTFTYQARDGTSMTRRIEPYRQVLTRGRWYLVAWDLDRNDWRTFRLDRITEVTPTGQHFAARPLPASTAADYLDASLKAPRHRAVITFHAPAQQVASRLVQPDGELDVIDGRSCRLTTWVDSLEWLAVTTLILGTDFTIDEPASFAEYCLLLRDRLGRALLSTANATAKSSTGRSERIR